VTSIVKTHYAEPTTGIPADDSQAEEFQPAPESETTTASTVGPTTTTTNGTPTTLANV
jgi:hypothetical protein